MITDNKNSTSNSNRRRYITIATTVFITTITILFLCYLRLSRAADQSTREFTSIGMGVAIIFGVLYLTAKLYHGKPTAWAQTEAKFVYRSVILSWFCFLFILHKMNLPLRNVSARVFVTFCILTVVAIVFGFVMRVRLFNL